MIEPDITSLLHSWRRGDPEALNVLLPHIYDELRAIAGRLMSREHQNRTLQPTALVNEAVVRLIGGANKVNWADRAHFLGICAHLMRQVLVDRARKRVAEKRGGDIVQIPVDHHEQGHSSPVLDVLALNEALEVLGAEDPRKVSVFELRFFAGLEVEEVAEVLHVSSASVVRDWQFVKAWLQKELFSSVRRK